MITNFGEIRLSEYRPEFRGLGVEEFYHSMDKLEHRYDQNLMATEQLREKVEILNVEDRNKDILHSAADSLYGTLTNLVEGGNLEYAERDLLKAARDFKNAPLLKESIEDYMQFQAWSADIRERGIDLDDPERFRQWQQLYTNTARTLDYDEEGNVINRFNLPRPVDTPDIAGIVDEFLKGWEADQYFGVPTSGDPNNPGLRNSQHVGSGYILFGNTRIKAGDPMYAATTQRLMSDPTVKAYIDELYSLDRQLNTTDIRIRLNNVGMDDVSIITNLIDKNVISRNDHIVAIEKIRANLNSQVDIINNPKASRKAKEKAIEEYRNLNSELDAASNAELSGIVLEEEDYIGLLEGLYYDGFRHSKLHNIISAYVEKYDMIQFTGSVKQDWMAKQDRANAYKKLEEMVFSDILKGEGGSLARIDPEHIREGEENYREWEKTIEAYDAQINNPNISSAEKDRFIYQKNLLETQRDNYLGTVLSYYNDLITHNPELGASLDNEYNRYLSELSRMDGSAKSIKSTNVGSLRVGDTFDSIGVGRSIYQGVQTKITPLTKEEFITEAILTNNSSLGRTKLGGVEIPFTRALKSGDNSQISLEAARMIINGREILPQQRGIIRSGFNPNYTGTTRERDKQAEQEAGVHRLIEGGETIYIKANAKTKPTSRTSLARIIGSTERSLGRSEIEGEAIKYIYSFGENSHPAVEYINNLGSEMAIRGDLRFGDRNIFQILSEDLSRKNSNISSMLGRDSQPSGNYKPEKLGKYLKPQARFIVSNQRGGKQGFAISFYNSDTGTMLVNNDSNPITVEVYPDGRNEEQIIHLVNSFVDPILFGPDSRTIMMTNPRTYNTALALHFKTGLGRDLGRQGISLTRLEKERRSVDITDDFGRRWNIDFVKDSTDPKNNGKIILTAYDNNNQLDRATASEPLGSFHEAGLRQTIVRNAIHQLSR